MAKEKGKITEHGLFLDQIVGFFILLRGSFRFLNRLSQDLDIDDIDVLPGFRDSIAHVTEKEINFIDGCIEEIKEKINLELSEN